MATPRIIASQALPSSRKSKAPSIAITAPPPARPENLRRIDELRARFNDFIAYVRDVKRHSPFTLSTYTSSFRMYCVFLQEGAHLPVERFRTREVALDELVAWHTRRGVRPITVNGYWRALRTFFLDREKRDGYVNPFRGAPQPPIGSSAPKALSAAECSRILLAAANYPWRSSFERELSCSILGTMLYAGLRRSEVQRLTMADVNLDDGTLRVVRGKGRFGGKDRMAYIPPDLDVLLRAYLRERAQRRLTAPELFLSPHAGQPIGQMLIRRLTRKVSAAAQVHFSPHVLRHSFVSHLLRSGVPLHIARDLAGHASIETTLGYLRVFDEDRKANIRKIRFG
ncbi:MAG TPA: tyrosine-type recombinase/integrase [Thermoanaerobaculaceae bacterium]|nr:tyrosine-type recombinase/integrase [Thermoanaerobaculaceae bacterium]HPS76767.1 tyrosine-type recombinase/integrase [Thermoanaerobaculaceae bacterium]